MSFDAISFSRKANNAFGSASKKETELFEIRRTIEREFGVPLDYENDVTKNGAKQGFLVLRTKESTEKKIFSRPSESFSLGDVIKCYGADWLVTELDPNTQIRNGGKITQCNYTLKFLDANGVPVSRPCIVENATKYNSGVKTQGTEVRMELGTSQYLIKLPFDSITAFLDKTYPNESRNQRLLMDFGTQYPAAYEISDADRVTYPGLIMLTLIRTERSENDSVENMIADYDRLASEGEPSPVSELNCNISFSGESSLFYGSGSKSFYAEFVQGGTPINSIVPVWSVALIDQSLLQYLQISQAENYVKIKVLSSLMIGMFVRLELKDIDNITSTYLDLEVKSLA